MMELCGTAYRYDRIVVRVEVLAGLYVELKCPLCGGDMDDDKGMANFLVCNDVSHGVLRFFTGDGCYFTTNEKVADELSKKGRRVHTVDPKQFFSLTS
jgi:hypothetical protein